MRVGALRWFIVVAAALAVGAFLRVSVWNATDSVHFYLDYENAFYWGTEVMRDAKLLDKTDAYGPLATWHEFLSGCFGLYDRVAREAVSRNNDYWLDYAACRLLVMSTWTKHVRASQPGIVLPQSHDVVPLLFFNAAMELAAALAMFLLVRLWADRLAVTRPTRWLSPPVIAFGAALLVWMNPAVLINSYAWPQWDVWILPFFLFGALAASHSRWFLCGLLLGIAPFFKAQILIITAFFPLWALFSSGRGHALRFLAGWFTGFVFVATPWMLHRMGDHWPFIAAFVVGAPLAWCLGRLRRDLVLHSLLASALVLSALGLIGHGSFAWFRIGFLYGSERHVGMFRGEAYNIPSWLADHGWNITDILYSFDLPNGHTVDLLTMRTALSITYIVALIVCAYAMSYHAKRRNKEVLLALASPWIAMFCFLGQMHERYLLWGAVISAAAALMNPGFLAGCLLLSVGSAVMISSVILRAAAYGLPPTLGPVLDQFHTIGNIVFSLLYLALLFWLIRLPAWEAGRGAWNFIQSRLSSGDVEEPA